MKDVDSYFEPSPVDPLYHYTGVNSLMGICTTRQIWAGNIHYMNDSEELVHAMELFEDAVGLELFSHNESDDYQQFLRGLQLWVEDQRGVPDRHLYIFSLSEEPSLLSQWRSYTPHGKGVSIAFPPKLLANIVKGGEFRLGRCLYEEPDKRGMFNALIHKLWLSCARLLASTPPNDKSALSFKKAINVFAGSIFPILALAKHEAFIEEKEWRLVSKHFTSLDNASYRVGGAMLVPYLPLPLGDEENLFHSIVMGPTPHEQLSLSALTAFIKQKKLASEVHCSRIPYREW